MYQTQDETREQILKPLQVDIEMFRAFRMNNHYGDCGLQVSQCPYRRRNKRGWVPCKKQGNCCPGEN